MNNTTFSRFFLNFKLVIFSILLGLSSTGYAQTGNTLQTPIIAGSFHEAFSYSDTQNTANFTNSYGRSTNDVFYQFTIYNELDVTISHCGSSLNDTYLWLLNASGNVIISNDDSNQCSNQYNSYIWELLPAGTYYVVSEGYSGNGSITTTISGEPLGNTINNPIPIDSNRFSDMQTTDIFSNDYSGRPTNDIFYRLILNQEMMVSIDHCGSSLSDTYLHLLDVSGNRIGYNDDEDWGCDNSSHAYLTTLLPAGTYYIVSEGYSINGWIRTNVNIFPEPTGNQLTKPIIAGTYGGSFSYSNSQNTLGFTDTYGRPSRDVFYRFILNEPMEMVISHCGSQLDDTYLTLLNASGEIIAYNDDSQVGECSNRYHSYLSTKLPIGTYYVLSEGCSDGGPITTTIQGSTDFAGSSFQNPIAAGTFTTSFRYTNTQDISYFHSEYPDFPVNNIHHQFILSKAMEISISHAGSSIYETSFYLLDASGNQISLTGYYQSNYPDGNPSMNKYLMPAGTYYVVSDGGALQGEITLTIEGLVPKLTYLYDASGNRIKRQLTEPIQMAYRMLSENIKPEKRSDKPDVDTEDRTIQIVEKEPYKELNLNKGEQIKKSKSLESSSMAQSLSQLAINVSPNPTRGQLVVDIIGYNGEEKLEIWLFDTVGRVLEKYFVGSEQVLLDLSKYGSGAYILQTKSDNETITTHRIIKK